VRVCEDPLYAQKFLDSLQCARQFTCCRDSYSEELRRTRVEIEYRREIRRATNGPNIDMTPGTKLNFVLFAISFLNLDIPIAEFYVLLTVLLGTILVNGQLDAQFFFYMFISILNTFRATPCSSSGESIVSVHHLVCVTLTL
jgi:hypothetical protein